MIFYIISRLSDNFLLSRNLNLAVSDALLTIARVFAIDCAANRIASAEDLLDGADQLVGL